MVSIAIVGIEGSGKTILATMLAKQFSTQLPHRPLFEPMTVETVRSVERCWKTLEAGEWPPSTPLGQNSVLQWRVHLNGSTHGELTMIDAAGQDLRQLFGEGRINDFDNLPLHLKELAVYVCQADLILLLINLGDICGVADSMRRAENQFAAKAILDFLCVQRADNLPQVALVFTQSDQYQSMINEQTGWEHIAAKNLPSLASAYLGPEGIPVVAVAAISKTKVQMGSDNRPRRVPVAPLQSEGLEDLVAFIQHCVESRKQHEISTLSTVTEASPPAIIQAVQPMMTLPPIPPEWKPYTDYAKDNWIACTTTLVFTYFILSMFFRGCSSTGTPAPEVAPPVPTRPIPVLVTNLQYSKPGLLDDVIVCYGTVRNDGVFGKVRVISWVIENDVEVDRNSQDIFLNFGEVGHYQIQLPHVANLKNKVLIYTDVVAP